MGTWLHAGALKYVIMARTVALIGAALAFLASYRLGLGLEQMIASAVLAALLLAITVSDLRTFRVPDALVIGLALTGLAYALITNRHDLTQLIQAVSAISINTLLCGVPLLLLREMFYRLRGYDGLGLGDVKLAFATGAWLDWDIFVVAVLAASMAALIFAGAGVLAGRVYHANYRIPLAAFLAPAIWLAWFSQQI